MAKWIVELEPGVFLAPTDGDLKRTPAAENAQAFESHPRARRALLNAQKIQPFERARVTLAPLEPGYCGRVEWAKDWPAGVVLGIY